MSEFQTVIMGLGYVGLPTALIMASNKIKVLGVDVDEKKIDFFNSSIFDLNEPNFEDIIADDDVMSYIKFSNQPSPADVFVICVPTPINEFQNPDLTYVESALRAISSFLMRGNLLIIESTVPIGSCANFSKLLQNLRPDLDISSGNKKVTDIHIAHCPERILPGNIFFELKNNTRIIGGMTEKCAILAKSFYERFIDGDCVIASSCEVAEAAKLAENTYRDVNIAFANELDEICHCQKINSGEVIQLANRHPRVDILKPGIGVGGHCIPVDPWFLINDGFFNEGIIVTSRKINDSRPSLIFDNLLTRIENAKKCSRLNLSQFKIIIYGLSYKPDINDFRNSPAVFLLDKMLEISQNISVVEKFPENIDKKYQSYLVELENAILTEAVHVLLVPHDIFHGHKPKVGEIIDFTGLWGM